MTGAVSDRPGLLRWVAKKAARAALALAAPGVGRVAHAASVASAPAVRALMYHRVRHAPRDPFSVTPEMLDQQMAWLSREGLAIGADQLSELVHGRSEVRGGSVLVTFDDGFHDFFAAALPILRKHRIPAILFVSVAEVEDREGEPPVERRGEARVSWAELAEIHAAGITIGSHGFEHVSLARLPPGEARRQIDRARAALEDRLGIGPGYFAYPYGTGGDFSDVTRADLSEAGYRCAFSAVHGAIRSGVDPLCVPRDKIEGGEGMWMFRRIVGGALDSWSLVDRFLWRLQAARRTEAAPGILP